MSPSTRPQPGNGVGDPVEVARQSIDHARRQQHDVVIIDTAGRLGIDQELMAQAAHIRDAVCPDEVLFVVDAMIGQDAVTTAQAFMEGVGFDGVVLTKLDGDARGGAALSVRHITGRPIMFASTGEKLEDFDAFHPDRMAGRILDMGDILTLIEQAQRTFDEAEAAKMAGKLASGDDFTLDDFLEQMMMVRKMGPIKNLLGMMPGMGQMRDQINQVDDKDLDRVAAIIRSMTPGERPSPKMINGLAPGPHRPRFGSERHRGQQPGDPLLRGPEDDEAHVAGHGHPRHAGRQAATRSSRSRRRAGA